MNKFDWTDGAILAGLLLLILGVGLQVGAGGALLLTGLLLVAGGVLAAWQAAQAGRG